MAYKMVVFDLDGVLIKDNSSWIKAHNYFGVDCSQNFKDFQEGRINYIEFMRVDIGEWTKKHGRLKESQVLEALLPYELTTGAKETVQALKKDHILVILSSGIDSFVNRVAEELGVHHTFANGLEKTSDGYLTGNGISRVPLFKKHTILEKLCQQHRVSPNQIIAVSDSRFDVSMLKYAGLGIAFNPDDDEIKNVSDVVVESQDLRDILPYCL